MAAVACRRAGRRRASDCPDRASARHFRLRLPRLRLARLAYRCVEARAMKHMRITTAHQSITFSRRMMLLGGAQAAVGGLLVGRMGWLAIAQNEKYQLLSESNRVQLIPVPPRRGWIIDRNGKPIAINKASFRVHLIPQPIVNGPCEQYAPITVRRPALPGAAASQSCSRCYPGGSTVGQLVGYVGAASAV